MRGALLDFPDRETGEESAFWVPFEGVVAVGWVWIERPALVTRATIRVHIVHRSTKL